MKTIKRIGIGIVLIVLSMTMMLVSAGYKEYQYVIQDMTINEAVNQIQQNQDYIGIDDVSQDYLNAVVAVEDRRFYTHGAVDLIGLMRAAMNNMLEGEVVQGGSTITQQLAKNIYFTSEQTMLRKVAEMFVAMEIEENYEKDEVLELYINMVYFGNGCYGIQEASEHFFDKEPSELTTEEAAYLAGLPQSPSRFASDELLAKERQEVVLEAMASNGYLD